jgi:hypothetical protein
MKPSKYDPAAELERPGCETGDGRHPIGRDPRTMTRAELEVIDHWPMSPLAALRASRATAPPDGGTGAPACPDQISARGTRQITCLRRGVDDRSDEIDEK